MIAIIKTIHYFDPNEQTVVPKGSHCNTSEKIRIYLKYSQRVSKNNI